MSTNHSPFRRRMLALANGGHVRGPGSGTSDSIPARLSDGEFVLPADTVRKVGVKSLRDLVDMTHKPSGKPTHPARFADGGVVDSMDAWARRMEQDQNARRQQANAIASEAAAQSQADADAAALSPKPVASAVSADPARQSPGSSVAQIPTDGYRPAPKPDGSQDSWRNTEVGRNLTNAAAALPGVAGAVPMVAKTGGAISSGLNAVSRLMNIGAATVGAAALPISASATPASAGQQPLPNGVNPSMGGAGRGSVNPLMADPSKPLPSTLPAASPEPSPSYGPIGDRTTLTNEQAATMNPAGRITVTRNANGTTEFSGGNVSGQVSYNDPGGKALPGGGLNGRGFSAFDVAPAGANVATGPNGSYAFASGGGQQQTSGGQSSPVGMTVEQAQREGMVGERVGYDPKFDQRLAVAGSRPSDQNMQAADNLAARQGQDARGRLMALASGPGSGPVEPGSFTGGYSGVIGSTSTYGNMRGRSPEQQRRDAEVSAGSIHGPTAAAGKAALAALNGMDLQGARSAGELAVANVNQQGGIVREGMQQAGENGRAAMTGQRYANANQIDRERLAMEQTEVGFKNRVAQRIESAQLALENAKTPAEQRSARERLLALAGKAPQNEWALQVTPTTKNLDGSTTQGSVWRYNKTTGDTARVDGGQVAAAPPVPSSRESLVQGQVYQTARGPARWDGGQFQLVR